MKWNKNHRLSGLRPHRSDAGDTLVEVLIAILIVSMILTGAYVTTNRSTLGVRNSQEHAEALKLIQGQLEQVRQNGAESTGAVYSQAVGAPFCMVEGKVVTTTAPCTQNSGGSPATNEPAYRLAVQRASCAPYTPPAGVVCHKFVVKASWESVLGSGQNNEVLTYRLYQ